MDTNEQRLVGELSVHVITRLRDHKVGLYEAMRILGYVQVAVAESVDLMAHDETTA